MACRARPRSLALPGHSPDWCGFHHALGGNHRGAMLLLTDGIDKVSRFLPICRGVDTRRLVDESTQCLIALSQLDMATLAEFDRESIPQIHLRSVRGAQESNSTSGPKCRKRPLAPVAAKVRAQKDRHSELHGRLRISAHERVGSGPVPTAFV